MRNKLKNLIERFQIERFQNDGNLVIRNQKLLIISIVQMLQKRKNNQLNNVQLMNKTKLVSMNYRIVPSLSIN